MLIDGVGVPCIHRATELALGQGIIASLLLYTRAFLGASLDFSRQKTRR